MLWSSSLSGAVNIQSLKRFFHLPAIYEFPWDTLLSVRAQRFVLCCRASGLRLAVVKAEDAEGLFFLHGLL